jgi:S1-C subfamily serine protease
MAWNAVQALKGATDANTIMVVLVGSGHVAYGLGIERQARAWFDGAVASVIAVPMADDTGPTSPVRASYANFVWGVTRELASAWPSLGLSTRAGDGGRRAVIDVEKDGPAAPAGLKVGDIILTIDDVPIDSREAMARQVASYNWGDTPRVTIARGAEQLTLTVPLRRTP